MRELEFKEVYDVNAGDARGRYLKQVGKCARGFSQRACRRAARMKDRHNF